MENSNSSALSDGAQQANIVSNENAEAMFGADQGETNMVKLVDGKLTPIGDTEDDVMDEQLRNRYSSDEERSLQGDQQHGKTYENSDAALRVGDVIDNREVPNDPIAEAELTGNPDAGDTVNTGLPSEDAPNDRTEKGTDSTPTGAFGAWAFPTGVGDISVQNSVPTTPPSPDPTQPVPGIPETPPTPPVPGPEIPDLPGSPKPANPEIQEPDQPDRSHEINAGYTTARHRVATTDFLTYTAEVSGLIDETDVELNESAPDESTPGSHYQGQAAGPDDQGMEEKPDTGDAAHPYDVSAKDADVYQPGERPEEKKEAQELPREMADESSVTAQDMISGPDRSDQKSTEGLDRKYNDPEAARDMAS
ncbi:hypothetical protein [Spirosoma endbachense]|uniref:Uncharacterized protein n=1 Tax=Spirosoma endbachense TaxID=2666025 RepID=A0A6P1VQW3_9BACT|nr:hypothetical protein [Spirosoma endbachense]QHV94512.1 hypothetical protein GJR95_05560 [Spirosoma endbachense]